MTTTSRLLKRRVGRLVTSSAVFARQLRSPTSGASGEQSYQQQSTDYKLPKWSITGLNHTTALEGNREVARYQWGTPTLDAKTGIAKSSPNDAWVFPSVVSQTGCKDTISDCPFAPYVAEVDDGQRVDLIPTIQLQSLSFWSDKQHSPSTPLSSPLRLWYRSHRLSLRSKSKDSGKKRWGPHDSILKNPTKPSKLIDARRDNASIQAESCVLLDLPTAPEATLLYSELLDLAYPLSTKAEKS